MISDTDKKRLCKYWRSKEYWDHHSYQYANLQEFIASIKSGHTAAYNSVEVRVESWISVVSNCIPEKGINLGSDDVKLMRQNFFNSLK